MGGDIVVHFTQDFNWCSSVPSSCSDTSGVIVSCLGEFLEDGSLYRYQYGAGWLAFNAKLRGGTCTTAKSDPPEVVMERTIYLLNKGFGKYNVLKNNCEDFALYCKTGLVACGGNGLCGSGQASSVAGLSSATDCSAAFQMIATNPVLLVAVAATTYTVTRYKADFGVRDDVVKVRAEDFTCFCCLISYARTTH